LLRILARGATPLLAVIICLGALLIVLAWIGFGRENGEAFNEGVRRIAQVVWERSIQHGRNYRYWVQALRGATPILLTGLAVAVAFRASVWNIGAEGQCVVGAIAATAAGLRVQAGPVVSIAMLLIAAAVAGAMLAAIAGVLEQWRAVPVVLSTLLLNFVAIVVLKAMLQGPLHEAGQELASEQLPEAARLPHLFIRGMRSELHVGFFIAVAAAIVVSIVLRYTTFGLRLRATGENPVAARFAGMRVGRVMVATLCLSGALAGMAGAIQISGVPSYQLLPDAASSGFGFTGIAVALLGRLSPLGVVLAALFFGWLNVAFAQLESQLNVPFLTLQAAQGAILIAMLVLTNLKWRRGWA
jgi:simple sugar transport system permease protein